MPTAHHTFKGLSSEQVLSARESYGSNALDFKKENGVRAAIKSLVKEPMVLLLLVAAIIYLVSGKTGDAVFLASAILLVAAISLYQDSRSRNALEKLKSYSEPYSKVIRNGEHIEVKSEELVIGDYLVVEEGGVIAADGTILQSNDFSVNESILSGEAMPVDKDELKEDHFVFKGTTVNRGLAIVEITAIGNASRLGKIGKSLEEIKEEKTPLEIQIGNFVKKMVVVGAVVFCVVWGINYIHTYNLLESLLKALTLAMSILPEEIPVAFTTFMALGAWRLMKSGIVVKQMKTVETLGSATVICTDKTGTLTENKMSLTKLFVLRTNTASDVRPGMNEDEHQLIRYAMWASEPIPFDPMEIALHQAYTNLKLNDERPLFKMVHEYPLEGKPPMMTHVFEDGQGKRIIAAKGAPEAIMQVSQLTPQETEQITKAINTFAQSGFRVLGVGETVYEKKQFPEQQQELKFNCIGLVVFYDPPKHNISQVLEGFYSAGIQVKIITGDNAATTSAIAKQIGFKGCENSLSGDELMELSELELQEKVMNTQLFTRMFPEAKLRIISALKAKGEIVAMTGDGVNDGPALKAAHIGIAMGKKGTELAKQAASLILIDDDLSKMLDAVAMGRKIYANLKKAIRYIISIHIPIILTVFIPLALGWIYPNIFSPIHVIFLELIMGPTCSIIYENEPMEKNTMEQTPRVFTDTFFNWHELTTSVVQGLIIALGSLGAYLYAVKYGFSEEITRTMVFLVLISANLIITLVNRSFYYSIVTTLRYKNNMVLIIISVTIAITTLLLLIHPFRNFFGFGTLTLPLIGLSCGIGFVSVIWYEAVKWLARKKQAKSNQVIHDM